MLAEQEEGGGPAPRILLSRALPVAEQIAGALRDHPGRRPGRDRRLAAPAWPTRSRTSTSSRPPSDPAALISTLAELPLVESVAASGEAGARVRHALGHEGRPARSSRPTSSATSCSTSRAPRRTTSQLREAAVRRGLHVSEYGILDDETGETLRCATEEEVYERLGYAWIPPELREGRGELEAARQGRRCRADRAGRPARRPALPHDAVRRAPDARRRWPRRRWRAGWEYLAVTDHSASHGFGDHVTPEALEERIEEIARAQRRAWTASRSWPAPSPTSSRTARSTTRTSCWQRLDWVIASVHTSFGMDEAAMTERMIAAIEHPLARRDRPPDRPQDRDPPAVRDRHDARDRGRRARTGR